MGSIYPNLDQKLAELDITAPMLAEKLNLSESELHGRMCGDTGWFLDEAIRICQLTNTSDIELLFVQLV